MEYKTFVLFYLAKLKNNTCLLILMLLLVINKNVYCQLIPDFSMPIKLVSPFGADSVLIGLSVGAGEGYDEAYDAVDTSKLQLPVDLRVYDPSALNQIDDNCKHFRTSYLDFPNQNTHQIETFERSFQLMARLDLEKIDNFGEGQYCDDPRNGTTFLQINLDPLVNYQYINDVGYDIGEIEIVPSGNAYLQAIDGTSWNGSSFWPFKYCITILATDLRAYPDCNIDLTFNVKLIVKNSLYVNINTIHWHNIEIMQTNNQVFINNPSPYQQIELFDLTGSLLFQQKFEDRQITIDMHKHNSQIYWLRFSQPDNNDYLIHKFFKL